MPDGTCVFLPLGFIFPTIPKSPRHSKTGRDELMCFRICILWRRSEAGEKRMFLTERQTEIVDLAKTKGRVLVEELAARFSVTPQTIRKDLNDLCDGKVLTRIHGGALFPGGNENVRYEARRSIAA